MKCDLSMLSHIEAHAGRTLKVAKLAEEFCITEVRR